MPDGVVRRRFAAGLTNLFARYLASVDSWQVYDNADVTGPRLIASRAAGTPAVIADPNAWLNLEEHKR